MEDMTPSSYRLTSPTNSCQIEAHSIPHLGILKSSANVVSYQRYDTIHWWRISKHAPYVRACYGGRFDCRIVQNGRFWCREILNDFSASVCLPQTAPTINDVQWGPLPLPCRHLFMPLSAQYERSHAVEKIPMNFRDHRIASIQRRGKSVIVYIDDETIEPVVWGCVEA